MVYRNYNALEKSSELLIDIKDFDELTEGRIKIYGIILKAKHPNWKKYIGMNYGTGIVNKTDLEFTRK